MEKAEMEKQADDSFYDTSDKPEATASDETAGMSEEEKLKQREEWINELRKLEDDIHTLQSVLQSKIRQATELKRKLGITPLTEMKEDFRHGLQSIKESDAFSKTSEAFKSFGAFTSKKIGEVRNSNVFKSVEEKVGGAYNTVKQSKSLSTVKDGVSKVSGSQSEQNLQSPDEPAPTGTAASTPGEKDTGSTPQ